MSNNIGAHSYRASDPIFEIDADQPNHEANSVYHKVQTTIDPHDLSHNYGSPNKLTDLFSPSNTNYGTLTNLKSEGLFPHTTKYTSPRGSSNAKILPKTLAISPSNRGRKHTNEEDQTTSISSSKAVGSNPKILDPVVKPSPVKKPFRYNVKAKPNF